MYLWVPNPHSSGSVLEAPHKVIIIILKYNARFMFGHCAQHISAQWARKTGLSAVSQQNINARARSIIVEHPTCGHLLLKSDPRDDHDRTFNYTVVGCCWCAVRVCVCVFAHRRNTTHTPHPKSNSRTRASARRRPAKKCIVNAILVRNDRLRNTRTAAVAAGRGARDYAKPVYLFFAPRGRRSRTQGL